MEVLLWRVGDGSRQQASAGSKCPAVVQGDWSGGVPVYLQGCVAFSSCQQSSYKLGKNWCEQVPAGEPEHAEAKKLGSRQEKGGRHG